MNWFPTIEKNRAMKNCILFLIVVNLLSCENKSEEGRYYAHNNWQKFRKEYDMGLLKGKPKEVTEYAYINVVDTILNNTNGEPNGFEKYKFNPDGEMIFWQLCKKDSQWVIAEMNIDKNGYQARYYSDKDSLKTYQNVSKVTSTKIAKDRYLMHSFFNIGPAFIVTSFQDSGSIVKKEYVNDSTNLKNVVKTITTTYNNESISKMVTTTSDGGYEEENYFYSKQGFLDSIQRKKQQVLIEREHFINNAYGDPVSYFVLREIQKDTIIKIKIDYQYDNRGNWIKRLENRVSGAYPVSKINVNYSLTVRDIKY